MSDECRTRKTMSEEKISIRLTATEKTNWEAAAKVNDKDVSTWVRDAVNTLIGPNALKAAVLRERDRIGLSAPVSFHAQLEAAR